VGALTREPGSYAHDLMDRTDIVPVFFGKPYPNAFEAALARLPAWIQRDRVAMLGDTLHTDILGAAAAGIVPILVTGHGVLKDVDADAAIAACGIIPCWIIPSI
jgi:ribonucleotide monophosphatase NagD (HAD superfamily)